MIIFCCGAFLRLLYFFSILNIFSQFVLIIFLRPNLNKCKEKVYPLSFEHKTWQNFNMCWTDVTPGLGFKIGKTPGIKIRNKNKMRDVIRLKLVSGLFLVYQQFAKGHKFLSVDD